MLIQEGVRLGSLKLGLVASVGIPCVWVFRKLRVAMFTTGSELRQPSEDIFRGEIYDSNRQILLSLLSEPWIEVVDLGVCVDSPSALLALLGQATAQADVIASTGGVSVGDEDHVVESVKRRGGRIAVRKVAIKPGKPIDIGSNRRRRICRPSGKSLCRVHHVSGDRGRYDSIPSGVQKDIVTPATCNCEVRLGRPGRTRKLSAGSAGWV